MFNTSWGNQLMPRSKLLRYCTSIHLSNSYVEEASDDYIDVFSKYESPVLITIPWCVNSYSMFDHGKQKCTRAMLSDVFF